MIFRIVQFFRWRSLTTAQLAAVLKELRMTTATTQALATAVSALSQSVTTAVATIHSELDKIAAAQSAGDDAGVQSSIDAIKTLTTTLDQATTDAANALNPPVADPNATPQT